MTVQDCWKAVDRKSVQDAVRSLLRKMSITAVEQLESYGRTRFCGALSRPCSAGNAALAPKRYVRDGSHMSGL